MNRVLCIGSVNLDHTYQVSHIVTGGETLACTGYQCHWGGKGLNQALAAARAGADAHFAGRLAAVDLPALQDLGAENQLDVTRVKGGSVPTGHAMIQIDQQGQNSIVICAGANGELTPEDLRQVLADFGPGDYLLLQNEVNDVPEILRAGKEQGLSVVLNPSPITPEMESWPLEQVDFLIFNEVEGKALTGKTDPAEILEILTHRCPNTMLLLTLGAEGACCRRGAETWTQAAYPAEAVDTTAAGDTFTGYFLAALSQGSAVPQAMDRAARASAVTVSRPGAVDSIPTWKELESQGV